MKGLQLLGIALVMFLALSVGSVYANTGEGSVGLPILGTSGNPALAAPSLFSGVITVLYADGTPVVLESDQVSLNLCNTNSTGPGFVAVSNPNANVTSGCVTVNAMLRQTAPGAYTYSFTPPSLTGTVIIYVKAYALADDNGNIFPQVDTSIGTYYYAPSTTTNSSVPPVTSPSVPPATSSPPTGNPVAPLTNQAVNSQPTQTTQPVTQASPIEPLLITLSVLAVAGCLLVVSKRH